MNEFIVDGIPISGLIAPFMSFLHLVTVTEDAYCSGTYLGNGWILTAAHCAYETLKITAFIGVSVITAQNMSETLYTVSETIIHPYFNTTTLANDIALLKLDSSPLIPSVILNNGTESIDTPGNKCKIMGYGIISDYSKYGLGVLREGNVTIKDPKNFNEVNGLDTNTIVIASGEVLDESGYVEDTCGGDSGSPLLCGENILSGVTSWGIGCGNPMYPGVYTRISHYFNWIQKQIYDK
jgi:secreted trypsin-like serine protease